MLGPGTHQYVSRSPRFDLLREVSLHVEYLAVIRLHNIALQCCHAVYFRLREPSAGTLPVGGHCHRSVAVP